MEDMPMELPTTGYGRTYPISIAPYDPAWPGRFEDEAARIREALGPVAVRVDHIGSTAVPGLGAKPVIDIQVSVDDVALVDRFRRPVEGLGYEYRPDPDDDEHEYFFRDVGGVRAFQIHLCPAGSRWERRHLAFRDHLRANPEDAARYEALKRDLAGRFPLDIHSYRDGKDDWIRSLEARPTATGDS
jgi:GrpB-like predicted nucleotidyltransferase (UPF0157 family)